MLNNNKYKSKSLRDLINSVFFVIVFIAPHTILSVSPKDSNTKVNLIFAFLFVVYTLFNLDAIPRNFINKKVFLFGAALVLFSIPKFIIYQRFSFFDILAPIMAVVGYFVLLKKNLKLIVLEIYLVILYVFYTVTFFTKIGSLQDVSIISTNDYYGSSSINSIPIALINTLYIYIVIVFFQKEDKRKRIFFFSLINLFFCIIQQSRSGLLISSLIFFYGYSLVFKTKLMKRISIIFLFIGILYISSTTVFSEYLEMIGNVGLFRSFQQDIRNEAVTYFFQNLTFGSFLFGYPPGTEFAYNIFYTYNTFLDFWNHYTFLGLLLLIGYSIYRIRKRWLFYYPLYFFIPFLIYSMVEPRYLPAHWDFFIYLMLFVPINYGDKKISSY